MLGENKAINQKSIPLLFLGFGLFHLFSGFFQIHFLPVVGLGSGTGYDGVWYIQKATNLANKVDDYHLFRILPSYLCYYILDFFGIDKNWQKGIVVFQYLNLIGIQGFIWLSFRLIRHLKLGFKEALIYSLLAFFNFNFAREAYYNPVMTDTMAAMFSMGILVAHLERKKFLTIFWALPLMFTFPFGLLVFLVFNIFKPIDLTLIKSRLKPVVILIIACAYFLPSIFWYYYKGRLSVYTFPDSISPILFPITLIINGLAFTYFFSSLWRLFIPETYLKVLKEKSFSLTGIAAILIYLAGNKILIFLNNNPNMNELRVFLGNYWTYLNLKPLIGLLDAVQFFGPVVCLVFVHWNKLLNKSAEFGVKHIFVLFAALFLIFLPEARHSLCLLPYLLFLLFTYFDFSQIKTRFIWFLGFSALIVSRYYYPLNWARFPLNHLLFAKETDEAIYQQFPAQHFFMHSGITISHQNYFIFLPLGLLITGLTWWYSKDLKAKAKQ